MSLQRFVSFLVLFCFFIACNKVSGPGMLPESVGNVDEIILVMDNNDWESGKLGKTMKEIFQEAYPVLPQEEPRFDLRQVEPLSLTGLLNRYSSIIYVASFDKSGPTSASIKRHLEKINSNQDLFYFSKKNLWATPQEVLFIFGETEEQVIANLKKNKQKILDKIYETQDPKAKANALVSGVSDGLTKKLNDKLNVNLKLSSNYQEVIDKENILWFREDFETTISNLAFQVIPESEISSFDFNSLQKISDEFGKNYVQSSTEGSYRIIDRKIKSFQRKLTINGKESLESKSLWRFTEDFMGGPLSSYLIHDPENKRYVFIEAFVFAPGEKKRKLMRRLDGLVKSITL